MEERKFRPDKEEICLHNLLYIDLLGMRYYAHFLVEDINQLLNMFPVSTEAVNHLQNKY
jgi:hypothetical protein